MLLKRDSYNLLILTISKLRKMRSFAATMALLWAQSEARASTGTCTDLNVEGKKKFSESRFEGRWYVIAQD